MYLTHSYVAIKKGHLDYLFFYLTEDYIQNQKNLKEKLDPLLEDFARNLMDKGALVKAFDKDISTVSKEVSDKYQDFSRDEIVSITETYRVPGLLIVNCDFQDFNPKENDWLYISFRDYIDDHGDVNIFELKDLLDKLKLICKSDQNLFTEAKNYLDMKHAISAHKIIEIKPNIFGISFDVKEAINFLNKWGQSYKGRID